MSQQSVCVCMPHGRPLYVVCAVYVRLYVCVPDNDRRIYKVAAVT